VAVDARIGHVVSGYRIERLLGRGGMGAVYLAVDEQLDRQVALKLLIPELSEDESFRERFLRESRLAASLEHPNVVPIYRAGEADGTLYIAMRYVEGTDLRQLLADVERLDAATVASLATQVASALDGAHRRGLVHRDVKPANVLLDTEQRAYLSDFGLTKRASSQSGLTATGQVVGTLDYVAPEQIEGRPVDGRADIYSLACLLHECSTGRPPFRRETDVATLWAQLQDDPPPSGDSALDAVFARGLAKSRDERYPTAAELADDLRKALGVSSGKIAQPAATARRIDLRVVGALAVLALAAAAALALLLRGGGTSALANVPPHSVGMIDPQSGKIVAAVPIGGRPTRVAIGPDDAWVANISDATLLRIDPRTRKIVKTIGLGFTPSDLAAAPGGIYVTNPGSRSVVRIDTATGLTAEPTRVTQRATARVAGPSPTPAHIVFGADSIWADSGTTRIARLRTPAGRVRQFDLGSYAPDALAFGSGALWTADSGSGVVSRFDPRRNVPTWSVPLSTTGSKLVQALAAGSGAVFAVGAPGTASFGDSSQPATLFRIDPRLGGVVASVGVGRQTVASFSTRGSTETLAVGEGGVWVVNGADGTVSQVDPATTTLVRTITVGKGADSVAAGAGYVWVGMP
jgi:serine/threonine-protein kinase